MRFAIVPFLNGPATQKLTAPDTTWAQWLRGGTAPEVEQVTFELSTDAGATWTALGSGSRISGGWTRTGLSLPCSGLLRARGRATAGIYNGSSSLIEQVASFAFSDTTPPTITCPGDLTTTNDPGQCGAVVTYVIGASDNCGVVSTNQTAGLPSGSLFPVGNTTNTFVVADAAGNTNACSFTVTVLPTQPVFGSCTVSAPGQFQLRGTGTAGLTYTVQTSTSLVNWVDRTNLLADPDGVIQCLMDIETNAPACFYRLRWP